MSPGDDLSDGEQDATEDYSPSLHNVTCHGDKAHIHPDDDEHIGE